MLPEQIAIPLEWIGQVDSAWQVEASMMIKMRLLDDASLRKWLRGKFIRVVNV